MPVVRKGPRPEDEKEAQNVAPLVLVPSGPSWRKSYDPEKHGALCSECPMRDFHVAVPPKGPVDSEIALVGEAPGRTEIAQLSPFVGQSGLLLRDLLYESWKVLPRGIRRWKYDDFWITNVLLHKQVGGDLVSYLKGIERWNKTQKARLKKEGREWEFVAKKDPVSCCLPRLLNELRTRKVVVLVGKLALRQADPKRDSIVMWRGSPFQWDVEQTIKDLVRV
jgi:uracil-DNA glycosylase